MLDFDEEAVTDACAAACAAIENCYRPGAATCAKQCRSTVPQCSSAYVEFLECLSENMDQATCDLPTRCEEPLWTWADCAGWCPEGMVGDGDCFACG